MGLWGRGAAVRLLASYTEGSTGIHGHDDVDDDHDHDDYDDDCQLILKRTNNRGWSSSSTQRAKTR